MCMIEALSATQTATERYETAMQGIVDLTKQAVPQDDQLPENDRRNPGRRRLLDRLPADPRQEAEQAEDLLPELSEFMLAPFQGAAAARRTNA
jgi:hypothetical protein